MVILDWYRVSTDIWILDIRIGIRIKKVGSVHPYYPCILLTTAKYNCWPCSFVTGHLIAFCRIAWSIVLLTGSIVRATSPTFIPYCNGSKDWTGRPPLILSVPWTVERDLARPSLVVSRQWAPGQRVGQSDLSRVWPHLWRGGLAKRVTTGEAQDQLHWTCQISLTPTTAKTSS